jgi:3-oxoacyl-[acyl-carrier protein] reductase
MEKLMPEYNTGRRVVVTGAAGVYGTWIAEAFAAEGARLLLVDFREAPLAALAGSLKKSAAQVLTFVCDLRDPAAAEAIAGLVREQWKSPDILVNNAGVYPHKPTMELTLEDWNAVMELNVTAPFLLIQALAGLMIEQGVRGSVVNMSSGAANTTRPGSVHYSTSKAALSMLTRGYALELAPHGIRVNAISPGFAPGSEVSHLNDEYVAMMTKSIPIGRTSGPGDSSQAVLFLCSEAASYITGTTLVCDGGRAAGTFGAAVSR